MVKRGGGVKDVEAIVRQPRSADRKPFVVVHLKVSGGNLALGLCLQLVLCPVVLGAFPFFFATNSFNG